MATDTSNRAFSVLGSVRSSYNAIPTRRRRILVQVSSLLAVLVFWEVVGRTVPDVLFTPFSEVSGWYLRFAREGTMYVTLATTVFDMLVGFGLTAVVGIPLGILMGRSYFARRLLSPWLSAFFVVATAALLPLFIVAFGLKFKFRIAIVWFSAIFHVTLNVYSGAKGLDENLLDVGRAFDASRLKQFRSIVLPGTLPYIISGLRMGLARSLLGIILAEIYIFYGYGGLILEWGRQSASTAPVLALIINIMVLAYLLRRAMEWAQYRIAPWSAFDA